MKEAEIRLAAQLLDAFAELPKVRRALTDKPDKFHDAVHLELSAAQMSGGLGQGSDHYFYVPPALGRAIVDAAEKIIRAEMKRLKVDLPTGKRR